MTSAKPNNSSNTKINIINIGESRDLNRISDDTIEYYISLADQTIDGELSEMYSMPLKKCPLGQWSLDADINEYNQIVELDSSCNLVPGDEIVIRDDSTGIEEQHVVNTIIDQNSLTTVGTIITDFSGSDVRVFRLAFPPPIPEISARLAASYIYDKFFSAQNSPNVSEYGLEQRKKAESRINDILNGKIIIRCQRRIGDQFGNAYLDDSYAHRDRGYNTSERNISNS